MDGWSFSLYIWTALSRLYGGIEAASSDFRHSQQVSTSYPRCILFVTFNHFCCLMSYSNSVCRETSKSALLKRHAPVLWPWQWARVHWWSLSAVTHAAARPDVTPALSAEWKCRRGRWRCRAAHSKRRKGRRCKTKPKACGWVHASQCSRLCRKALRRTVPTEPGALRRTRMHSTTLRPPGGERETRRTCYLIRREIKTKKQRRLVVTVIISLLCLPPPPPPTCHAVQALW